MAPKTRRAPKDSGAETHKRKHEDEVAVQDGKSTGPPSKAAKTPSPKKPKTTTTTTTTTNSNSKAKAKAKSGPSKAKAQTQTQSQADNDANKKDALTQKVTAERGKTLDWLFSSEAFELAHPSPDKGYGEVDWGMGEDGRPRPRSLPAVGDNQSDSKAVDADEEEATEDQPRSTPQAPASEERKEAGERIRYPHTQMAPLQTLLCALLLSKPLSHKLGVRTISTLLNPPYSFGTFSSLSSASEDRVRASLWTARTQHKEKTATQLLELVDSVRKLSPGSEDQLEGVREQMSGLEVRQAQRTAGEVLKTIKGLGDGAVGIFLRRVQGEWEEVYPFADERCLRNARELGLISPDEGAEELAELVQNSQTKSKEGKAGKEERERFVRLLDTLIGIDLEKKMEEAKGIVGL